jgi:hypothetical protein
MNPASYNTNPHVPAGVGVVQVVIIIGSLRV